MSSESWMILLGNGITLAALLLAFRGSNHEQRERAEENARRLGALETKMDTIFRWFERNIIGG